MERQPSSKVVDALKDLCLLIPLIERPQRVHIVLRRIPRAYSPDFDACLQTLLSRSTLESVSFATNGWAPAAALLHHCPNIRRLSLTIDVPLPTELEAESRSLEINLEHVETLKVYPGYIPLRITLDRKSTRLNSSHSGESRMPSSA